MGMMAQKTRPRLLGYRTAGSPVRAMPHATCRRLRMSFVCKMLRLCATRGATAKRDSKIAASRMLLGAGRARFKMPASYGLGAGKTRAKSPCLYEVIDERDEFLYDI